MWVVDVAGLSSASITDATTVSVPSPILLPSVIVAGGGGRYAWLLAVGRRRRRQLC